MHFTKVALGFLLRCGQADGADVYQFSWLEVAVLFFLEFNSELPVPSSTQTEFWVDSSLSSVAGQLCRRF